MTQVSVGLYDAGKHKGSLQFYRYLGKVYGAVIEPPGAAGTLATGSYHGAIRLPQLRRLQQLLTESIPVKRKIKP